MFSLFRRLFGEEVVQKVSSVECFNSLQGGENPRKKELRAIARTIGSLNPTCPYCQHNLPKFPQRKTKCKSCGDFFYSRKEPFSGEKRILREDELQLLDEIKLLSMNAWDGWHANEVELQEAKKFLAIEWGCDPSAVSDSDARWRINHDKSHAALSCQEWESYRSYRVEAVRQLLEEGKNESAFPIIGECIYLAYAAPSAYIVEGLEFMEMEKRIYHPELWLYREVAGSLSQISFIFQCFAMNSSLPDGFDLSPEDAWKRFERDYCEYEEILAGDQ